MLGAGTGLGFGGSGVLKSASVTAAAPDDGGGGGGGEGGPFVIAA